MKRSVTLLLFALFTLNQPSAHAIPGVGHTDITVDKGKWVLIGVQYEGLDGKPLTVGELIGDQLPTGSLAAAFDVDTGRFRTERRRSWGWPHPENALRLPCGSGFWVMIPAHITTEFERYTVSLSGKIPDKLNEEIILRKGLNLVTYPFPKPVRWADTALAQNARRGDSICLWNPETQTYETNIRGRSGWGAAAHRIIMPGDAFWIRSQLRKSRVQEKRPYDTPGLNTYAHINDLQFALDHSYEYPDYPGEDFILIDGIFIADPFLPGLPIFIQSDFFGLTTFDTMAYTTALNNEAVPDFSGTNNQVEEVDEADLIKTDGQFIYHLRDNTLFITRSHPVEDAEIAAEVPLDIYPQELFLHGDQLLLMGRAQSGEFALRAFDISDRYAPKQTTNFSMEGDYNTARMIGNYTYIVIHSDYGSLRKDAVGYPLCMENDHDLPLAPIETIGRLETITPYQLVTVLSYDFKTQKIVRNVFTANDAKVYASAQNLYLAHENGNSTVIDAFRLQRGYVGHIAQGEVPGHILNQFSMDEFEKHFRIAVTEWNWSWPVSSGNHLFILDQDLQITGSVENLAPGERIYAARFMGPKAYIVTFRQVDPLFTVDLHDPHNPVVKGELKIPGFSEYIHPLDANHLLGIGFDDEKPQIAIFDVSDDTHPVQLHKLIIEDGVRWGNSFTEHKKMLIDPAQDLFVVPMQIDSTPTCNPEETFGCVVTEETRNAFLVLNISIPDGIAERGRIEHPNHPDDPYSYYNQGLRSLYIGDTLYTLSHDYLQANDLHSLELYTTFDLR